MRDAAGRRLFSPQHAIRGPYPLRIRPGSVPGTNYHAKVIRDLTVSGSNSYTGWTPTYSDYANVSGALIPVTGMPDLRGTPPVLYGVVKDYTGSFFDARSNYLYARADFGLAFYSGANQVKFGGTLEMDYNPVNSVSAEAAGSGGTPNAARSETSFYVYHLSTLEQQSWEPDPDMTLVPNFVSAWLHGLRGSWSVTYDVTLFWVD